MRRNLDFFRGQTETFSGVLRDAQGNARDLTNATLVWRAGRDHGSYTELTLSEGDGITVTTGTGGQWSITIAPDKTANMTAGHYLHQGEATIGSDVYGFVEGRMRLRRDLPS